MQVLMLMRGQGGVPGRSGVPGGQVGMAKIAAALARLGTPTHVFVSGPRPEYLAGLTGIDTTTMLWPLALDRMLARAPNLVQRGGAWARRRVWRRAVARLLARVAPDVVHVQGLEDGEALLAMHDGPTVITHWGRAARWRAGPRTDRGPARRARPVLVALGDEQAAEMAEGGWPPDEIIPAGFDAALFAPGDKGEARRRLGLVAGDGLVLYVGRLAGDKNVGALLDSFAAVVAVKPFARLVLVGNGPLAGALCRRAAALGIAPRTTHRAYVPQTELVHYYRAADVAVVPSDKLETFCMVALEAIASNCPLVVTDRVPEIVSRFPGVAVVDPYDIRALRDIVIASIEGRLAPARSAGIEQFTWHNIAQRYCDLYRALVVRSRSNAGRCPLPGDSDASQRRSG